MTGAPTYPSCTCAASRNRGRLLPLRPLTARGPRPEVACWATWALSLRCRSSTQEAIRRSHATPTTRRCRHLDVGTLARLHYLLLATCQLIVVPTMAVAAASCHQSDGAIAKWMESTSAVPDGFKSNNARWMRTAEPTTAFYPQLLLRCLLYL